MPEQDNMQEQQNEAQQEHTSQDNAHAETHDKRFKSQEEAERAYAELSRKLGQQGSELGELRKKLDGSAVDPEEFTQVKSQLEEMKAREWVNQAASAVGGGDNLKALNDFIAETYTDEAERAEIVAACRNPKTGMATLRGLAAEAGIAGQQKAATKGPIKGAPPASPGESQKEYTAKDAGRDALDPRFQSDPTFKAAVLKKLAASKRT